MKAKVYIHIFCIFFVMQIHTSTVQQATEIAKYLVQPFCTPETYLTLFQKVGRSSLHFSPGTIFSEAVNTEDDYYSKFNELIEASHPNGRKFIREEGSIRTSTFFSRVIFYGLTACINPQRAVLYAFNNFCLSGLEQMLSLADSVPDFKDEKSDRLERKTAKLLTRTMIYCAKFSLQTAHFCGRLPRTTINKMTSKIIINKNKSNTDGDKPDQQVSRKIEGFILLFAGLIATGTQSVYFEWILRNISLLNRWINQVPTENIFSILSNHHNKKKML